MLSTSESFLCLSIKACPECGRALKSKPQYRKCLSFYLTWRDIGDLPWLFWVSTAQYLHASAKEKQDPSRAAQALVVPVVVWPQHVRNLEHKTGYSQSWEAEAENPWAYHVMLLSSPRGNTALCNWTCQNRNRHSQQQLPAGGFNCLLPLYLKVAASPVGRVPHTESATKVWFD